MRIGKLEVTAPFFLMLAWLNYLDRQGLVPLCVLACCFHELGHLLSIRLLSGDIKLIRLTAVGAEMVLCRPMGYGQEMVAGSSGTGRESAAGCPLLPLELGNTFRRVESGSRLF